MIPLFWCNTQVLWSNLLQPRGGWVLLNDLIGDLLMEVSTSQMGCITLRLQRASAQKSHSIGSTPLWEFFLLQRTQKRSWMPSAEHNWGRVFWSNPFKKGKETREEPKKTFQQLNTSTPAHSKELKLKLREAVSWKWHNWTITSSHWPPLRIKGGFICTT